MKKIAILTCLNAASSVCTGATCFAAVNKRTGAFSQYSGEEIEVEAFFHCNGCESDPLTDEGMKEKMERIIGIKLDAVHFGICTKNRNGEYCDSIKKIINHLEENNIKCIEGTH